MKVMKNARGNAFKDELVARVLGAVHNASHMVHLHLISLLPTALLGSSWLAGAGIFRSGTATEGNQSLSFDTPAMLRAHRRSSPRASVPCVPQGRMHGESIAFSGIVCLHLGRTLSLGLFF